MRVRWRPSSALTRASYGCGARRCRSAGVLARTPSRSAPAIPARYAGTEVVGDPRVQVAGRFSQFGHGLVSAVATGFALDAVMELNEADPTDHRPLDLPGRSASPRTAVIPRRAVPAEQAPENFGGGTLQPGTGAAGQILSPLRRLQFSQRSSILRAVLEPPLLMGMM